MDLLEENFAHFGYPHALVKNNAATFLSEGFQAWCRECGIMQLTGAPFHPRTNGAAEHLVQSLKTIEEVITSTYSSTARIPSGVSQATIGP